MPIWLEHLLQGNEQFVYLGVFLAILGASMGMLISSDLVLITCSYFVYQNKGTLPMYALMAITGMMMGDSLIFGLAYRYGDRLLTKWPFKKMITREKLEQNRLQFKKFGYWLVFFTRFLPLVRNVLMFNAGLMKLKYPYFIICNFLGALVVVPSLLYAVTYFAGNQALVEQISHRFQWIMLVIVVFAALVFFKKKTRKLEN